MLEVAIADFGWRIAENAHLNRCDTETQIYHSTFEIRHLLSFFPFRNKKPTDLVFGEAMIRFAVMVL